MIKINSKFLIAVMTLVILSCSKDMIDNPVGNLAPKTEIFLYPDSSVSKQPSKINLHWWGDDPDGLIIGYYFSWDAKNWTFTSSNDSSFALQIGITDTNYTFRVSAVDNSGNGKYDSDVFQNGIDYGPEPFVDSNGDGIWEEGESFIDIGLIDPDPASIQIPIKNSAPKVEWDQLTVLPDTSFPAMSFSWIASDLDGDQTIQKINIALNDTSNSSNIVSLDGSIRNVSIVAKDYSSNTASASILIGGLESNTANVKLPNLLLNNNNKFFVQAVDISGAKSPFIAVPGEGRTWYVKKPKGDLLIVDDYRAVDNAPEFYVGMFNDLGLQNKYDVYDFHNQEPPFLNVTFLLTMKLYKYVFWYTDNNPSIDLLSATKQKYIDAGGRIALSMQFPQTIDLSVLSGFLPISADSSDARLTVLNGTKVSAQDTQPEYPDLEVSTTVFRMKSFYVNPLGGIPVYYFPNKEMKGYIGFTDTEKKMFFIGLPLNKANGGSANVQNLLKKVFIQDFGLTP